MKKFIKKLALAVVALLTFSVGSNYTVKEVKAASETSELYTCVAPSADNQASFSHDYGYINMFWDANGQSSKVRNYSNPIRVYKNHKVTFSIADTDSVTAIEKIVITANSSDYASAAKTSWTNATATSSGSVVTVTPTDGTKNIVLTASAQTRWSKIQFTYTLASFSTDLTDDEKVSKSLSAVKNNVNSFYASQSTIELPASSEDYGTSYSYTLEGDSNVYIKNSNSLIVNPTNALKEATLTVTASVNGVEDSLDVIINSASNTEVLPLVEAIKVANYFGSTYSSDKFYIEGDIQKIYDTTYGNLYIQDDSVTNDFTVYGLYDSTGKTRYDAMETKPIAGDTIKVYGILGTYSSKPQMKNGWLIEHTINSSDSELIALEKTTASLGFDYSLTEETVSGVSAWKLVTTASELAEGDKVIIAASESAVALSTNQKSNNRGQAIIVKVDDTVTFGDDVQELTLEKGTIDSSFSFNTGSGYLYAASSSSNHLKTQATNDANSSWKIEIKDGVASVVAQGANTRNVLQYNESSSLFACYASATQKPVSIYKLTEGQESTVIKNPKFDNISILFGAEVETSLFESFTSVKAGVMFSAGDILNAETAVKKDVDTLVENDGFYSVGAVLEIFADGLVVTDETKDRLSQNITAAVYFVVNEGTSTEEIIILDEKTTSVKLMVETYINEYSSNPTVQSHMKALLALQSYIG